MSKSGALLISFLLFRFALLAQYPNVLISTSNFPNEPAIMINPKNPNQLVAGSNIDNYYYSSNGGQTWQEGVLQSSFGVWGDPVIGVDTNGHFFFLHLSNPPSPGNWIDRIVCQKSLDGGATWNNGSYMGLNGTKAQDKHWIAVDPATNNLYVTWTQFDEYSPVPPNPLDSSIILFSKSLDGGATWSQAKRLSRVAGDCIDSDNTVEGAVPAVGPNGEVYVSWAGPEGLVFDRSLDQGETWLANDIFVSDIPGGWDYGISGISRANGLPITCCDLSNGPNRGTIYINWSDQRNGTSDTDVWMVKSTDGGNTWSERKRVNNDPPGKQQFFTWMTIDQANGNLYFVFYDRRNYTNNFTDVYMALSTDGGESFTNFKVSQSSFNPLQSVFFGDYTNICAYNGMIRPIWTALNGSNLSIYTALIDTVFTSVEHIIEKELPFTLDQNYPNPGEEQTYISFKMHTPGKVTLKVLGMFGRTVATLIDSKLLQTGKYVEHFDISTHQLSPGIYYFSLDDGNRFQRQKMVVR